MRYKIKEFAVLAGVSVRTLHYYDEIGLLKPEFVEEYNGYRFYSEKSLERMQEIMFYRELDFSLKDIMLILSSPDYDKPSALIKQRELLELKLKHTERLICAIDEAMKGVYDMNAFNNSEYEKARKEYAEEARRRWGNTAAYNEYEGKSPDNKAMEEMDKLIREFAECSEKHKHSSPEARELVKKWQDMITRNFYTCTDKILLGLAQMYATDERFIQNMDKYAEGTAKFIAEAISSFLE